MSDLCFRTGSMSIEEWQAISQDRYCNQWITGECKLSSLNVLTGEYNPSGYCAGPIESKDPTLKKEYRNLFGTMENPRPVRSAIEIAEEKWINQSSSFRAKTAFEIAEEKYVEALPSLSNCIANFNDAIKNLQEIRERRKPKQPGLTLWEIIWQFIRVVILGKQPV